MALKNYASQGASVTFGGSGLTGKITSIGSVEQSRDALDVTDLSVAKDEPKLYIPADIYDPGTFDVEFLYAADQALPDIVADAETITITWPAATTGGSAATFAGSGFIQSRGTASAAPGEIMKISCTVQFDGETEPAYTAGS
tara:strand:+ start:117 stop:542 length:426 start_codon:yes stop_codon:yes gene_type:complete